MHELSLARDLLVAIERKLDRADARVVRVSVSVGSAAGIASESLRFAFRIICEGTRAAGATLSVTTIAARGRCADCGIVFEFDGLIGRCPGCGRLGGELLSGDRMILRTIEVADV
ncbi:MAG TPA: hydrogenase maturation nickel metallochaperone HypA [Candidatus Binataceae bacterium]|nr:hydrogenase maturation nickel metallochaperone HypA [Candidatus Binataceae bacterium]